MSRKSTATIHSQNRSSKIADSTNKIGVESNFKIAQELLHKYERKYLLEYLFLLGKSFKELEDNGFVKLDNIEEIINTYYLLVNSTENYSVNLKDFTDTEIFGKMYFFRFYVKCAMFGINLNKLQDDNHKLSGFNDFLLKESPETYKAYCKLANQYGFKSSCQLVGYDIWGENKLIFESLLQEFKAVRSKLLVSSKYYEVPRYALFTLIKSHDVAIAKLLTIREEYVEESIEMVALGENLESENKLYLNNELDEITSALQLNENQKYEVQHLVIMFGFDLIGEGLLLKLINERIESHQIDDILSSFSNHMNSKCKCFLNSNGGFCFELEAEKDSEESHESLLIRSLGICACFRINLEFLEYRNPELFRLNEILLDKYPETYTAYCALSKEFGFDRTVNVEFIPIASDEEFNAYLRNMKIERWGSDLMIDNKVVLDKAVSDNICTGSINENDITEATSKKVEAKKRVMSSKSTVKKNRSNAKKLSNTKIKHS